MTYSDATIIYLRLLAQLPNHPMTFSDLHCAAVHLSDARPITEDAGWVSYVSAKAPCLLPR